MTMPGPTGRVIAFFDGLNFSRAIKRELRSVNLSALALHYASFNGDPQTLEKTYHFTAYPHWLPKEALNRQKYVEALNKHGVTTILGEFKVQRGRTNMKYREKQIDTAIAATMVHLAHLDQYDHAFLFDTDEDAIAAIRIVLSLGKQVTVIAPPGQKISKKLASAASSTEVATLDLIKRYQLPARFF